MGKLTKSLKAVSQQLNDVQNGINQMQTLGEELGKNSFRVAEAALRTGYAYAKAETGETINHPLLPNASPVLDKDKLKGANSWTQEALKARFGTCKEAYGYLRNVYQIKLPAQSWKNIVAAFNGTSDDIPIEQRVIQLEQTVVQQAQYILVLEGKINQIEIQLQHFLKNR
ncbi:MAG TPA: hypothetical protein V6D28_23035 [Leptolyngbyaceae cyanobacterium]